MTSDGPALLAAILANPEDDTPRLVYADWLDENAQPFRAEFIRAQIAVALGTATDRQRIAAGHLFSSNRVAWFPQFIDWAATIHRKKFDEYISHPPHHAVFISRGFVSDISCSMDEFLSRAVAFLTCPITDVTITDRHPAEEYDSNDDFAGYRWDNEDSPMWDAIPSVIHKHLLNGGLYDSELAARIDLSRACVAYGQELANIRD